MVVRAAFAAEKSRLTNYQERREHHAFLKYIKDRQRYRREDFGLHHSPNESPKASERKKHASLGTSPGYPDLILHRAFALDGHRYAGLAIEMKRVRWGYQGVDKLDQQIARAVAQGKDNEYAEHIRNQALWLARLRANMFVAEFARGCWEAVALTEMCYGAYAGSLPWE